MIHDVRFLWTHTRAAPPRRANAAKEKLKAFAEATRDLRGGF
jgi:hypothetical protein